MKPEVSYHLVMSWPSTTDELPRVRSNKAGVETATALPWAWMRLSDIEELPQVDPEELTNKEMLELNTKA